MRAIDHDAQHLPRQHIARAVEACPCVRRVDPCQGSTQYTPPTMALSPSLTTQVGVLGGGHGAVRALRAPEPELDQLLLGAHRLICGVGCVNLRTARRTTSAHADGIDHRRERSWTDQPMARRIGGDKGGVVDEVEQRRLQQLRYSQGTGHLKMLLLCKRSGLYVYNR